MARKDEQSTPAGLGDLVTLRVYEQSLPSVDFIEVTQVEVDGLIKDGFIEECSDPFRCNSDEYRGVVYHPTENYTLTEIASYINNAGHLPEPTGQRHA